MAPIEGAVLPKGSWILVTGANGFVGSHVVDQFLRLGYNVRGTVRDTKKNSWLAEYFPKKYPNVQFELVEVKDMTDVEALKKVADGCSGFAAIASDVTFGVDADKVITPAVELAKAALEASAGTPSIKRFVQTSSSAAAVKSEVPAGTPYDLAVDNFNEYAVQQAYRPDGAKDPAQPFWVYMASKVQQEKAIWKWREDKRKQGVLGFGINTVLPDFVVGEILQVEKQGYPSSLGMLKAVWDGDLATASTLPPQFEIDAKDTAMLHIAALLHPDVDGERIFGFAELKNLTNTLQYMRELYPDRTFAEAPAGERENKANLLGQKRAEELLRWVKGSGWTSYKESLKQVCDTLL